MLLVGAAAPFGFVCPNCWVGLHCLLPHNTTLGTRRGFTWWCQLVTHRSLEKEHHLVVSVTPEYCDNYLQESVLVTCQPSVSQEWMEQVYSYVTLPLLWMFKIPEAAECTDCNWCSNILHTHLENSNE